MKVIKKLGILSVGRISAIFGIIIGFISGFLYWGTGSMGNIPPGVDPNLEAILFSPWAILFMPVIYGLLYFLAGVLISAIYNIFSKWVGGIKIDI